MWTETDSLQQKEKKKKSGFEIKICFVFFRLARLIPSRFIISFYSREKKKKKYFGRGVETNSNEKNKKKTNCQQCFSF